MNNKGMTLVELLITFSLLMIVIVGMFNLILDAKMDLDNKEIAKDITEYSNFINNDIHYDLITRRPFAIAIKNNSENDWNFKSKYGNNCSIVGDNMACNITNTIDDKTTTILGSKDNLSDMCKNTYPCAVYAYYNDTSENNGETVQAEFESIAIYEKQDQESETKYGIRYKNVFEEIPHYESIEIKNDNPIEIKFDDDFFIIDYPLYIMDDETNTNYGFKIAYTLGYKDNNTNNA